MNRTHGGRLLLLTAAVLMLLTLSACAGGPPQEEEGLVGIWETSASVLGIEDQDASETALLQFHFNGDFSGKSVAIHGEHRQESSFSYTATEAEIEITFPDGTIWTFPYQLSGDVLTLTQHHTEISYARVS